VSQVVAAQRDAQGPVLRVEHRRGHGRDLDRPEALFADRDVEDDVEADLSGLRGHHLDPPKVEARGAEGVARDLRQGHADRVRGGQLSSGELVDERVGDGDLEVRRRGGRASRLEALEVGPDALAGGRTAGAEGGGQAGSEGDPAHPAERTRGAGARFGGPARAWTRPSRA
jgi:hypothetical protein